jgi:hypothetical protein
MNLMLTLDPQPAKQSITYSDQIVLVGSCFSDNIGAKLKEAKFQTVHNPTGIVFDPLSVARHLSDMISGKQYQPSELFQLNELWLSWFFHSDFSSTDAEKTCAKMIRAIQAGSAGLISASYLFITLGTAYSYLLKDKNIAVANNHKAPGAWFEKRLLEVDEMVAVLQKSIGDLRAINPGIQVVFTVSPVKHIRDGVIENNRSKARLLEAVHQLAQGQTNCSYFPAYELVTDVLRDYRFYAPDMAHPNPQAILFVFDFFCKTYFSSNTQQQMQEVLHIVLAKHHRPLHPDTLAHQHFLKTVAEKIAAIKTRLPGINWAEEELHFSGNK